MGQAQSPQAQGKQSKPQPQPVSQKPPATLSDLSKLLTQTGV